MACFYHTSTNYIRYTTLCYLIDLDVHALCWTCVKLKSCFTEAWVPSYMDSNVIVCLLDYLCLYVFAANSSQHLLTEDLLPPFAKAANFCQVLNSQTNHCMIFEANCSWICDPLLGRFSVDSILPWVHCYSLCDKWHRLVVSLIYFEY